MNNIPTQTDPVVDVPLAPVMTLRAYDPAGRVRDAASAYELVNTTDSHDNPTVVSMWRDMLSRGNGPEKLYQTPEFFRYSLESAGERPMSQYLYAVRRKSDGAQVGIIPVRKSQHEVAFGLGPLKMPLRKMTVVQVMGSIPLLDDNESGLVNFVFEDLLKRHPDCGALSMQAVPVGQVDALKGLSRLSTHLHNGLRDCHTVPLPEKFSEYLQKFSAKKRYNLTRQVRLLSEQAGEVAVCRIETPEQIPALMAAMHAVLTPAQLADFARQPVLDRLARHGLLHSYVIRCGTEDVAVVYGTRSAEVWHVHKISALSKYHALSVGTSAVHLALEDVIENFSFVEADFGYGAPNQEFRATHVLKTRAAVLVTRKRSSASMLLTFQGVYQRATNTIIAGVKAGRTKWNKRRLAARK